MKPYHRRIKKKKFKVKQSDFTSRRAYTDHVLKHGTEEDKAEAFAHFTNAGYGCMAIILMAAALLIGIALRGAFGYFLALIGIGWVLWKVPNVILAWKNVELYNPELKKYRIDNLNKWF